ncbi:hypothetical protein BDV28DRAFT_142089 [Aspergillus coremiiformis]|uniref:Uncharacterized protein n=1 Tax=Aspergillus coremiiformis TaxID=138285 RepID=A0A5N6YU58_9EURO|nr:hypothetical protein BDV28DRAFT_142089 [Aspergillus coremiiformis]
MQFWVEWALWQKLSLVLAGLIFLVLIYSLCVLIYNRRAIKKHAAAEAHLVIQDAEKHPMLSEQNEVPFGAKALERGVHVEGIWTPGRSSAGGSSTPTRNESPAPVLKQLLANPTSTVQRPTQTYMPVSQTSKSDTKWASTVPEKRAETSGNLHFAKPHQSDAQVVAKPQNVGDSDPNRSKVRISSRFSWVSNPFDKRMSGIQGMRANLSFFLRV